MITTNLEKMIIAAIIVIFIIMVISVFIISKSLSQAGGVRNIVIETGKDVKDISREIKGLKNEHK